MESLTAAACTQLFAKERIAELESNLSSEHKHRSNGQGTPASKRAPKPELTPDDEEDRLIDAILDHDPTKVAKLSGKIEQENRRQSYSQMMTGKVGG